MPLITVIVTCYNVEKYLDDCLRSVVSQTLDDMEVIVVDDGSTDDTAAIIRKFERADPRVRSILLPENTIGGVGSAANAGLDAATGDYIGFVDGDDYVERDMFEKMCDAAKNGHSELVVCRYLEFDGDTGEKREPAERSCWAGIRGETTWQLDTPEKVNRALGFIAVPWRKIYARALLDENAIRFPVVDYYWEDNPFHWFSVCSAKSVSIVPEVLCYHRVGRAGQTMISQSPDFVKVFGHHETIRAWLSDRGMLPQYEGALLSWALSQYEWVVGRLTRESGGALYDALRAVVQTVDESALERALQTKLRSTGTMMRWVQHGDKRQFLEKFERRFDAESSASNAIGAKLERGVAMIGLAKENMRVHGFRNTVSKVLMRVGVKTELSSSRNRGKGQALTDENMTKLLAILQRDIDRKHAEVLEKLRELEQDLKEGGGDRRQ